ncbi:hypothetical protein BGZ73_009153, partial [Actinomortierella ambigua]
IYIMTDEYDSHTHVYLDRIDSVHWEQPRGPGRDSLLVGFWASVKSSLGRGISKCYLTGVSPQSLEGNYSGFNVSRPVSWKPELTGFCGLTDADVTAALALGKVCATASEAKKHLKIMRDHYSGFSFAPGGQGPLMYNTNTCLEYLQV